MCMLSHFSHVQLFATLWTVAYHAPLSMGFLRQEYWSGLPYPLVAQRVENLPAMQETQVQSLGRDDPWRREWLPTPVFLPGESRGQRSQAGYSPQGPQRVRHD